MQIIANFYQENHLTLLNLDRRESPPILPSLKSDLSPNAGRRMTLVRAREIVLFGLSTAHGYSPLKLHSRRTRRPASFVRGAQLAKSVRLIIFQRPFSRRLLSAPLYRRPFLRCRGPANLGSRSLGRFPLSLCRQLLLPYLLLYRVCLSP